jgi:hypothetical protein
VISYNRRPQGIELPNFHALVWEESYNMFSAEILTPKRFGHYEDLYHLLQDPLDVFKLETKEASLSCWLSRT